MKVEVHATTKGIEVLCAATRANTFVKIDDNWDDWYRTIKTELAIAKNNQALFMLPDRSAFRVMALVAQDSCPHVSTGLLSNALGMFLVEHGDEKTQLSIDFDC
ncbi:hypothetical protein pEaSNUABM11_00258 [Erwinia phage pEa_SNUABM_11]|nr:hypothetical protein pEaSNUABM11_00258 [Erwinia phage pEa_SNUABM_11]